MVEEVSAPPTEILPDGTKIWRNSVGQLHRVDGPAVIRSVEVAEAEFSPLEEWYRDGGLHRAGGPACTYSHAVAGEHFRTREWYKHNKLHRVGGPARIVPEEVARSHN